MLRRLAVAVWSKLLTPIARLKSLHTKRDQSGAEGGGQYRYSPESQNRPLWISKPATRVKPGQYPRAG
jgi:hypothetical protein